MPSRFVYGIFAVLVSCGAATVQRKVDDGPPPVIHLTLDVRGNTIGLTGAAGGPMCEGVIAGTVSVTDPKGKVEPLAVNVKDLSQEVCVGCDPTLNNPHSCDNACRREFRDWIDLAHYPFDLPGEYAIGGADLTLACAPGRLKVASTQFFQMGPATPTKPVVATEPRRAPRIDRPLAGSVEGLMIPVGPRDKARGISKTRWGEMRTFFAETPYVFVTGEHGPYWMTARSSAAATPTPFVIADGRAHVLKVTCEDSTPEAQRAAGNGGAVLSASQNVDGSFDVSAALDDSLARWSKLLADQSATLSKTLTDAGNATAGKPFGPEKTGTQTAFAPTWLAEPQRLFVQYTHRVTRWSEHQVPETQCPRNRPGPCQTVMVTASRVYHADMALELEYDRSGKLLAERTFSPHPVPE